MNNRIAKIKPSKVNFSLALTSLVALTLLFVVSTADAAVTKTFNATHSLTGDCGTSSADPVPDPGCPGGTHPPEGKLMEPGGVATDGAGNVFILNRNESQGTYAFNIDVFGPDGRFITAVPQPGTRGIAVDSTGHLYVVFNPPNSSASALKLIRYDPTVYEPAAGEVEYGSPPVAIEGLPPAKYPGSPEPVSPYMTINPTNDHLFFRSYESKLFELGKATDGVPNSVIAESPLAIVRPVGALAFDAASDRLYVVDGISIEDNFFETVIRVFDSEAPYALLETIDGSAIPPGTFGKKTGEYRFSLAVDEATGHLFVGEILEAKKLYELDENFDYVGELKKPVLENQSGPIVVDNSEASPNRGYLYVPSGYTPLGRLFAYEPKFEPKPAVVESLSFTGVMDTEALLRARVNPKGLATHWTFEYTSQQNFETEGFTGAKTAGEGNLAISGEGSAVEAPATGLTPGTTYRFRVRAENQCEPGGCVTEEDGAFTTFVSAAPTSDCANQSLRTGPSAALPDCRAYELVTPANTGGLLPEAPEGGSGGPKWPTSPASPNGSSLAFMIFGGLIPGMDATGGPTEIGDVYNSIRTGGGWKTAPKGPNGTQATRSYNGGLSADHGYLALEAQYGSLDAGGNRTAYLRYPDGSFHVVGEGSLATDPHATSRFVSSGGSHIHFLSKVQLEPAAPVTGTGAIYDRTADGTLHVVSLLPGEVTPNAGQDAQYLGASTDGSAVAFQIQGGPIYLRVEDAETLMAGPVGATYAGLSEDGRYLFYLSGGDLHRFDTAAATSEAITTSGNVVPANIGGDGTAVYFLSQTALPTGPNPVGAEPQPGARNLYRWSEGATGFVATVTERDAEGKVGGPGSSIVVQDGLGLWIESLGSPALLSSRTTTDGSVLLFKARAELTGVEAADKAQIFRYDADEGTLLCLSCNPTGAVPQGDSGLIAIFTEGSEAYADPNGLNIKSAIANLSTDGARAFFETPERLVVDDNDGLSDVYQWEAEGKGGCTRPGGCVSLISSGQSGRSDHLFGVSETGNDVFIFSSDLLIPEDGDETPSIYDARVDGGFRAPEGTVAECLGEACQPAAVAPEDLTPSSATFHGAGNVTPDGPARNPSCRKGKRLVRKGKPRCVTAHKKKHHKKRSQTRAHTNGRAGR